MALFRSILLALWIVGLGAGSAFAEKRVALVIGNSAYEKVARLGNPSSDAVLVANTLKAAGFDLVDLRLDLKVADMRRALRDFIEQSRDAEVAVVYYAGHGIEVDGVNYLVPIDAVLERDTDIYDEALSLDRVLVAIEPAKKLRLVVLDACRDSPFSKAMKRTLASRAIGRGLAKVEPSNPNTLIAFASKAGSTALDGDGKNSPFTAAMVHHVTRPGLDLRKAFGYVRDEVLKSTANRQEPYLYGSLGGDDLSLVPAAPSATGPQGDPQAAVRRDYELALQLGTRDGWDAFLSQYPDGFYANLARGHAKKIAAEEARAAAAEKARLAEQERARLAAEGARQFEIEKAAAAAKAAEEARIAAEKLKQIEQDKAAAAERTRLAAQEKAAQEQALREQALREKALRDKNQQVAALPPSLEPEQPSPDTARALQAELRRVGCNVGVVDGVWDEPSRKALDLFNKHAGMKLNVNVATTDALDAVKNRSGRICPLICESGYRAEGDRCTKITCRKGYVLNDDNECDKKGASPVAKSKPEMPQREARPSSSSAVARADAALSNGTYQKCMGPITGCYARAIQQMDPERAKIWCSRRPTC
ncbi:caspase family protein [Bradyrhizobium daqingense]|uniref:Putative caspase-like protein n=1 Tax=Bradyrhizobium daqingense TaxID=993502 RepID=A0A562KZH1_9BRAD|nr:caspase family protein [Bradyrhizobium daqingense]TWI00758.1 putative caspase-like protein [Bradyrhizobium daqingense]UFS88500.1 caspase family protein [Bradyrhizobium daqingense]